MQGYDSSPPFEEGLLCPLALKDKIIKEDNLEQIMCNDCFQTGRKTFQTII
jgi:hypothetical protein